MTQACTKHFDQKVVCFWFFEPKTCSYALSTLSIGRFRRKTENIVASYKTNSPTGANKFKRIFQQNFTHFWNFHFGSSHFRWMQMHFHRNISLARTLTKTLTAFFTHRAQRTTNSWISIFFQQQTNAMNWLCAVGCMCAFACVFESAIAYVFASDDSLNSKTERRLFDDYVYTRSNRISSSLHVSTTLQLHSERENTTHRLFGARNQRFESDYFSPRVFQSFHRNYRKFTNHLSASDVVKSINMSHSCTHRRCNRNVIPFYLWIGQCQ